jgi:hypothetical protein
MDRDKSNLTQDLPPGIILTARKQQEHRVLLNCLKEARSKSNDISVVRGLGRTTVLVRTEKTHDRGLRMLLRRQLSLNILTF